LTSVPARIDWRYATRCAAGQNWSWDGVRFKMLHPDADRRIEDNDSSCVLQIEAANGDRLLLPGDIEATAERELVTRYGDTLRSDVLVAPHHGSRTSSTSAFIRAVAPEVLLIPAGHRNRYGFPHPTVSARYRAFGTPQWRTGESGALHVRLGDQASGLGVLTERQRDRRYWHLPTAVPPER
jgi:competence protein ComEC